METPVIFLCLFVVNLGVALGAGIYETRLVLPKWFPATDNGYAVDATAMNSLDSGRNFWGPVTTLPLTLLTLINVYLAFGATPSIKPYWLAAVLLTVIERTMTFTFFIPTAIRLAKTPEGADETVQSRTVSRWLALNHSRIILNLAALLLALFALAAGGVR